MKANEVHKMSDEEIREESARLRKRLFEMKSQALTEKLENPMQLRDLRRDIARLLTVSRSRQLQGTK